MKRLPLGTNVFQFTKAVRAVLLGTIITVGQAMAAEKPGTTPPIDSVSVYWVGHSLMNTPLRRSRARWTPCHWWPALPMHET